MPEPVDPVSFVYDPFDGPFLDVYGGRLRISYDGTVSEGRHSLVSGEYDSGGIVPPHAHPDYDEVFTIIEGDFEFWKDDAWVPVKPGQVVFSQRGVIHGFRVVGDSIGRLLAFYSPAGFEQLLP